jgi:surface polysaccharide O-acyltransferase-like enzyme
MESKKGRIFYLDFIRVLAIFLVIFIHVSAIDTVKNIGSTQWQITKLLNFFAHMSVPLFFMISGTLLLNSPKTASLSYTWKKRIPHVVIPFIAWSFLSTYLVGLYSHSFDWPYILKMYAVFLYQPVSPTLWFMYPLIGLYILSPILRTFVENANNKMLLYLVSIWLITNSLMPSLSFLLPKDIAHALDFYPAATFFLMGGFVGYFILGYLISKLDVTKINAWLLIIVMLLACYTGNAFAIRYPKSMDMWNQSYVTSIFILIMSVCGYILLQKWGQLTKSTKVKSVFAFFSPLVFGIYLIHNILILYLEPWFMSNLSYTGVAATFTRYFAVAILSTIIIWILSLIPGVNYVLTGTTRRKRK